MSKERQIYGHPVMKIADRHCRRLEQRLEWRERELEAWRNFALHESGAHAAARALDLKLSTEVPMGDKDPCGCLYHGDSGVGAEFASKFQEECAAREAEAEYKYKVVVHRPHGGFGLSKAAMERVSELTGEFYNDSLGARDIPRHHWALVKTVEELRWKAHYDADYDRSHRSDYKPPPDEDWGPFEVVELKGHLYNVTEYDGAEGVDQPGQGYWTSAKDGFSSAEPDGARRSGISGDAHRSLEAAAEPGTWICDECNERKPRVDGPAAWRQLIYSTYSGRQGPRVRAGEWWCAHCDGLSAEALDGERKDRERSGRESLLIHDAQDADERVDYAKADLKDPPDYGTAEQKAKKRQLDELILEYGDVDSARSAQQEIEWEERWAKRARC